MHMYYQVPLTIEHSQARIRSPHGSTSKTDDPLLQAPRFLTRPTPTFLFSSANNSAQHQFRLVVHS